MLHWRYLWSLNFKEIFSMFIPFSWIFILSWIVSPSCNKLLIFASSHNFKRLSIDTKWSFNFDFLLGFWRHNTGIMSIALSAIDFNGKSWMQSFKNRIISSIFPCRSTCHHKQVSFTVAVTVVISRCYVVTVILLIYLFIYLIYLIRYLKSMFTIVKKLIYIGNKKNLIKWKHLNW